MMSDARLKSQDITIDIFTVNNFYDNAFRYQYKRGRSLCGQNLPVRGLERIVRRLTAPPQLRGG